MVEETVQEVVQPQEEVISEPSEALAPTQVEKPWQDVIAEIQQKVGDEEFSRHPAINARAQSIAAKQRKQWEQEQRQLAQESTEAHQLLQWYAGVPKETRADYLESDPALYQRLQRAKQVVSSVSNADGLAIAKRIWEGFKSKAKEHEDFSDADFEKLEETYIEHPDELFVALLEHGDKKRKVKMSEEIKATVTEELARRAKSAEGSEPEFISGGHGVASRTFAEIEAAYGRGEISTAEYARARQARNK